jgi:hypothetical protein
MSSTYPFVNEFITDSQGRVVKVVLPVQEYQRLLEAIEDEGLLRAMKEVENQRSLSWDEALAELEKNENAL